MLRPWEMLPQSDIGLVDCVRNLRHLVPAEKDAGESDMALLILWEVDHEQLFPRQGGDGAAALVGFTAV